MFEKPQAEHQWLHRLIGTWRFDHECDMPDGSKSMTSGQMVCRTLGGLWLLAESSGASEGSGSWSSLMTLGYDTAKKMYVGTFIGSMMSNIWPYYGLLEESGNRLPLYSEGPKFDGSGIGKYRDTIEWIDANTWLFSSEIEGSDGGWKQFMIGKHTRVVE